jgi:hypothetical protein
MELHAAMRFGQNQGKGPFYTITLFNMIPMLRIIHSQALISLAQLNGFHSLKQPTVVCSRRAKYEE